MVLRQSRNFAAVLALTGTLCSLVSLGSGAEQVSFRDIHKYGKVKVIGNSGLPVGQIITIEGRRAKPSKTSDAYTLIVEKVDGNPVESAEKRRWPADIQIRNTVELPESVPISLKGFEVLNWVGAPDINWHVETYFVVTEVLAPKTLVFKEWSW